MPADSVAAIVRCSAVRRLATAATTVAVVVCAANVFAQSGPSSSAGGPLVLTPIPRSIVVVPAAEVTEVNHQTATLVGGYAGQLTDDHLLIGGGAYSLVDPRSDARLFYGGLVLGWRIYDGSRVSVGARGLVGAGASTLYFDRTVVPLRLLAPLDSRGRHGQPSGIPVRFGVRDDFLVAEPQVEAVIGLNRIMRLDIAAGYRVTSAPRGDGDLLRGATGSIGLQFDIGD